MDLQTLVQTYGAIPELTSYNRYMFVGPHPDDIEFGCGGLISKLKELGKEVVYVIVTDGAAATIEGVTPLKIKETRYRETEDAAALMGIKKVEFLGLEDGGDYEIIDVIRALAPMIVKYSPEIIFAPDSRLATECHPDHIKTGEAVRLCSQLVIHPAALARHHISIEEGTQCPSHLTLAFYFSDDCNKCVEISEMNLNEKFAALMLHTSQMQDDSAQLLLNYFKLKAFETGKDVPSHLAEAYKVLVPLIQHCCAESIHY